MSAPCSLCGGACARADLGPLLDERLRWLWEQIARTGDRRGDPALVSGTLSIRAPVLAEARAAVGGLLGGRILRQGQSRNVDLAELTLRLRVRGPGLTPGAVAAHAVGRPLAARSAEEARRERREGELKAVFVAEADQAGDPERIWSALRQRGWVTRVLGTADPIALFRMTFAVLSALPSRGERADRRHLAANVAGNPHALDQGTFLAAFVLAVLAATGKTEWKQRPRAAWASVGVEYDDVTGGLIAVGILPAGWSVPEGVAVTLPPRELGRCEWPRPAAPGAWVFVTENPSIVSAAADLARSGVEIRLLCTNGTPSAAEIDAIARLASVGWRVAVRADFDAAGLGHVKALLGKVPGSLAWRMGVQDYLASVRTAGADDLFFSRTPEAAWDPGLSAVMREKGVAGYEEALLPELLEDMRRGFPAL